MKHTSRRRALPVASAAVAVLAGLAVTASATAAVPTPSGPRATTQDTAAPDPAARAKAALVHALPGDQVFPESVAVDPATGRFYVGSVKDGTLYTGRVGAPGDLRVFSPAGADGRTIATGLAFAGGRLVVAGRQTGQIFVYDTRTARLVSRLDTGLRAGQTFLNDVAIAPDGSAYVTDSVAPVLWRAKPRGTGYDLEKFMDFTGTPVRYVSAPGAPGINVNGIAADPSGRHLVIGKRNENALYRVDIAQRRVTPVTTPSGTLNTPDGLVLRGRTLYVVQNQPGSVKSLALAADLGSARALKDTAHSTFAFPTGAAVHKGRLLVVNSQFNTLGSPAAVSGTTPPKLPFWVSELRVPAP
ncbi:SMP-30/gluconolactonase/LRE family protein [Streptomyces sp. NPDC127108]|uniref:SMP-30/gluconolactonase/LRE family protein n=1 Tax=Streptomyces sp. NPDC127108 TaxID=3345361 RepID=UPI00363B936E